MTFVAVVVTIVITVQDRRRADERSRRERLWSDAELIADLRQLLVELDPQRRGANAIPGPAEDERWASLSGRVGLAEARLHTMAISHPSEEVRAEAKSLPEKVWGAYAGSREFVTELLRSGQNLAENRSDAETRHKDAVDALRELEAAVSSRWQSGPLARGPTGYQAGRDLGSVSSRLLPGVIIGERVRAHGLCRPEWVPRCGPGLRPPGATWNGRPRLGGEGGTPGRGSAFTRRPLSLGGEHYVSRSRRTSSAAGIHRARSSTLGASAT
jgi:hypothetical protein